MSDFREDIANIVKKSGAFKENSAAKAYFYPNIPEKVIKGVKKGISGDIGIGTVAAIIDTSFLKMERLVLFLQQMVYITRTYL